MAVTWGGMCERGSNTQKGDVTAGRCTLCFFFLPRFVLLTDRTLWPPDNAMAPLLAYTLTQGLGKVRVALYQQLQCCLDVCQMQVGSDPKFTVERGVDSTFSLKLQYMSNNNVTLVQIFHSKDETDKAAKQQACACNNCFHRYNCVAS